MDLIKQYNKWAGENQSLLRKALTSASGSAEALIPQHLEQVITNSLPRLSPLMAMVTPAFDPQKLHEFNRLTSLPAVGGAMGEGAVTPTYQPVFQRASVPLKVIRRKGATTDFLQDSSKKNVDAAATNIEASLLAHVYDIEHYLMYGNASSNTYEFSGYDTFITTNRENKAQGGVVPTSLAELDDLIDQNLDRQGANHNRAFIMSPFMLSKFSQLLTNVRLNQGLQGAMSQVDVNGGWRLNAYRDIPIIVSSSCRPKETMGTVTPTTAATGGSIADGTHYFMVAAVTRDGETLASAEVSQVTGSANVSTVTLSFAAVTGAYKYKIYYGATSGACTLISVVPAFAYDANGTIAVSTSNTINTNSGVTSDATGAVTSVLLKTVAAHTEVPTALQADKPLVATGGVAPEIVMFVDFDEYQGIGRVPYTSQGARFNGLVCIEELAKTDAFLPFMIYSHMALADCFEATCGMIRGLRTA